MGRPKLADGEKRVPRSIKLTPAEIAWLESRGGVSRAVQELVQASMEGRVSAPPTTAPQRPAGISQFSGKPLCPDCQRKGANPHCRKCGLNAKGGAK